MTSPSAPGRRRISFCVALAAAMAPAGAALSQEPPPPRYESRNLYGMTGLIDMPTARVQPDAELGFTSSYFGGFMRNTLSFQVLPRVEAAFRYSIIEDFFPADDLFDRSFDIKILLSDESRYFPAVALGLRDFLGTGIYSSEYFVATKEVAPGLQVTGGLGWGRLSGTGNFENPLGYFSNRFKTRGGSNGTGKVNVGEFFRGPDMGGFAGVEWRPSFLDGLALKAEYSTDAYLREQQNSSFDPKIPFNFGAEYRVNDWFSLGAYAMYGSEFGVRASIGLNPTRLNGPRDLDPGPTPMTVRPPIDNAASPELGAVVVERIGPGPALGSDAGLEATLLSGSTEGARWAKAPTRLRPGAECPVDDALDVDAELGVIDGVTFLDSSGAPLCSVLLRETGRRYVEGKRVLVGSYDTSWANDPANAAALTDALSQTLDADRVTLVSADIEGTRARVEIANPTYNAAPQAIGRTARAMANVLPPSVEDFEITLLESDLPTTTILLRRARLEAAVEEPDAERTSWVDAELLSAEPSGGSFLPEFDPDAYPTFSWFLSPALPLNLFDPDSPLRADLQLVAGGELKVARGLGLNAAVSKSLLNGFDDITRTSDSVLPRVRSDFAKYLKQGDPGIDRLTGDYLFKVTPETYGRVSLGYLERMFGGVSGEVLWKPSTQDWGLGLEVNYVAQRDFDMLFGFQDYDVVTGHASVYWDTGWHGMEVQIDAGRYLAGDWGGTFTLTRRFANGWEIGGFFTLTDVPFDEYGEGSFDKGIRLTIPFAWGLPYETRSRLDMNIRPLTRDGGARLSVANRLYPIVQEVDRGDLRADWGHFWR
ncbi:YjbH domain-containing protein [Albimonas sp. CAU 1670]|uniref:YjbH domain-containing protein n=1 Tax=Albimonas sp. CAU 1670 TaxID=3032599 RepID=UPI0023D9D5D7|nr:YjbH domain-containing protein [Albimonas sp. CAU 1670]MDF2235531.1 YjbH domain-containing protein [Albimonas sp. CAU 1670]